MFFLYSYVGSNLNVLLLPRPNPTMDAALVAIDARFGYSWPDALAWASRHPAISDFLRNIYLSTQTFLFLAFIAVGAFFDVRRLHKLALACVLGGLITVFFWAFFPTSGACAYWTLDPKIVEIVRPVAGSAYGAELNRLMAEGVTRLDNFNIKGLVGFPSFHTVMALVIIPALWPLKALRLPLIASGLVAMPGILIHGGHNLMDIPGGIAVLVVSWYLAEAVLKAREHSVQSVPMESAQAAA